MKRVLVLGATGTLGKPVAKCLVDSGQTVRVLARDALKAKSAIGAVVEVVEGDSLNRDHLKRAVDGCDAVHVSLPTEAEFCAMQHLVDLAPSENLDQISYVSGTSVREENRWFPMIDAKLRSEELLRQSGIPYTIFCPTWAMETLQRFIRGERAAIISAKQPPGFHFFAAADFGKMVATSYQDERALGKRLYIHGPECVSLTRALEKLLTCCYPNVRVLRLTLWQAKLIAKVTGQMGAVTRLIAFFDRVGELGDPTEANALLGIPATSLDEWIGIEAARIGHGNP